MQCNKEKSINFKGASLDIGQREKCAAILIVEALIDLNHHGNHHMSGSVITWDTKNKEQRAHRKSEYLI